MIMGNENLQASHYFFEHWLKTYEATYGKIIDMPIMGPAREGADRLRKNFEATINMHAAWAQSIASYQSAFAEATRKTQEEMEKRIAEGVSPSSYKAYYDLWMETYSETFKEFLKSRFFATDLAKLTSNSMDFQKSSRILIEENLLRPANLPTRTEMDDLNKEVYLLKKQVRELVRDLRKSAEKK
jgi:class III poly(R)-hydroxyalkanoic acid synthase PhaE subunit